MLEKIDNSSINIDNYEITTKEIFILLDDFEQIK